MRTVSFLLSAALLAITATTALADPPRWAPAHGYRDKHDDDRDRDNDGDQGERRDHDRDRKHRERYYVGYSGTEYVQDFDIPAGRCNRDAVGAVLGGVVGGVVGNQVGSRDNRVVATIIGVTIGALIGAKIGSDMDDRDRGCFGQALELGTGGRRINWVNPGSGVRYALVPLDGPRAGGAVCRNFELTTTRGRDVDVRRGRACQARPGVWELAR